MKIEEVLVAARDVIASRAEQKKHRVADILGALDEYDVASEHDLAVDLSAALGMASDTTKQALGAAQRLQTLVHALPELGASFNHDVTPPATQPVADTAVPMPGSDRTTGAPGKVTIVRESSQALALTEEFDAADLRQLDDDHFVRYAREFAARTRVVLASDPENMMCTRIIRALTKMAAERPRAGRIFGLRRTDRADWAAIVDRAAAAREAHLRGASLTVLDASDEEEASEIEGAVLPVLGSLSQPAPVVIAGGHAVGARIESIRRRTGVHVEWPTLDGPRAVQSIAARILEHGTPAILLVERFIAHKTCNAITAAAQRATVPLAYVGTGGVGQIVRGLRQIEAHLTKVNEGL